MIFPEDFFEDPLGIRSLQGQHADLLAPIFNRQGFESLSVLHEPGPVFFLVGCIHDKKILRFRDGYPFSRR